MNLPILLLLTVSTVLAGKCRGRYYEMRGGDGFIAQRGCRGLDTQISEEYWTTVGYDGVLRDGRTTDDFLVFPDGPQLRNSFVGYWITRTKYGDNRHYEAFGHVFTKPDGRVCGWFVGMEQEVVEVCGGFRVLSRSRRAPHEPIPFEWVQGEQYRNRDTLGFHHHKIAKYEVNADEAFYGDADIKGRKFHGVSPVSETFVKVDQPDVYFRKVWLLKKKAVAPISDITRPSNIVVPEPRNHQRVHVYSDPHHEARISEADARRLLIGGGGNNNNFANNNGANVPSNYRVGVQDRVSNIENQPVPSRTDPGYKEWLLNQYRLRGIDPYRSAAEQRNAQNARIAYEEPSPQVGGGQGYEPVSVVEPDRQVSDVTEYGSNPSQPENDSLQGYEDQAQNPQHVRLVRYRPRTVIRDKKGNMYEQHIENGKIVFYTVSRDGQQPKRIEIADIDPKIEAILESRRLQESRRRHF